MVNECIEVDLSYEPPSNYQEDDEQSRFVRSMLPMVVQWPRDATRRFLSVVYNKYFRVSDARVNQFRFAVLVHRADTPHDGALALSRAGAFATRAGREVLLAVVSDARKVDEVDGLCKGEVLDVLERYAQYAFVLDGTVMTCGMLKGDE